MKRSYSDREDSHAKSKRRESDSNEPMPALHSIFYGEVASVQQYGVFVKIPEFKKQGLVHKSQMSKVRVDDPSEMLATGEKVYCKVISLENNKIGLSMKVVNQTTGRDEDSANVQSSMDLQKNRKFHKGERPKIELGAVLDTTCKKCGGHGHLAQDCFHVAGGKSYDLLPDDDEVLSSPGKETKHKSSKSKKKKNKKEKKSKKAKKRHHANSSTESEDDSPRHKKHKKRKHRRKSSSSDSDG
ncbi:zinc finger CCHC domain-containing protein 17-like [Saccostrea echinata]|uniref:zinc finger CCHC domain-containing protein 17-like n=1 Tax=Saccostrea echinata TaxID=191078 RepID=UPI002A835646|nr:zinc finger CCHC domain-containing protein 17-like [Saccostrea echinata]